MQISELSFTSRIRRKILTITDNPAKELKLEVKKFISNDAPVEALGSVSDTLIFLCGSSTGHVVTHGLPVGQQLRAD